MAAYLIGDIDIHDLEAYAEYRAGTPAAIAQYGGRFLVRGGPASVKEGGWTPGRMVVVEFPDMAAAEAFYNSPEYAPLLKIRKGASTGKLLLVEGA